MNFTWKLAPFALAVAVTGQANAATYDLAGDFSNAVNPNGPWSFLYGNAALTHFAQPATGNSLEPAAANGYWGMGPDFNTFTPEVLKVTVNGSDTATLAPPGGYTFGAPFTNQDFLAGDVILHSPNAAIGGVVSVNWTAPTAGILDFTSSAWYAHSFVNRSNGVSVFLGNTLLTSFSLASAQNRSSAQSFAAAGLSVASGDALSFRFAPTTGQPFGSLSGLSVNVDFTPNVIGGVPEPASWALMIAGFGLTGAAMRRRAKVAITYA